MLGIVLCHVRGDPIDFCYQFFVAKNLNIKQQIFKAEVIQINNLLAECICLFYFIVLIENLGFLKKGLRTVLAFKFLDIKRLCFS